MTHNVNFIHTYICVFQIVSGGLGAGDLPLGGSDPVPAPAPPEGAAPRHPDGRRQAVC